MTDTCTYCASGLAADHERVSRFTVYAVRCDGGLGSGGRVCALHAEAAAIEWAERWDVDRELTDGEEQVVEVCDSSGAITRWTVAGEMTIDYSATFDPNDGSGK